MITRLPDRLAGARRQVRRSVFQVRRGEVRRALVRMLNCDYCEGLGWCDFVVGGEKIVRVLCGECNGGYTAAEIAAVRMIRTPDTYLDPP